MRFLLASTVLLNACSACATKQPAELPGIPLEVDPSWAIQTPEGGGGHACPVNGMVLTATHVMTSEDGSRFVGVAWSDGFGGEGFARVLRSHNNLDITELEIVGIAGDGVHYLPSGSAKAGEKVFWFEYDFRTRANALRAHRRFAKILRIVAQHYVLDEMPVGGASGTCLINERGEVVGLVVAAWPTDDKLGVGSAVKLPVELTAP